MAGSGLQELFETVYASNTVTHMLTGKAFQRAVWGLFLVDSALNAMMVSYELSHLQLLSHELSHGVKPPCVAEDGNGSPAEDDSGYGNADDIIES